MTDYLTENKLLMEYLRDLKMPSVKEYIEDVEKTANAEQWTYRQFLCKLMEEEVIKDRALCSALVDRLCHKAFLVNMSGASYRVKETQIMLKYLE